MHWQVIDKYVAHRPQHKTSGIVAFSNQHQNTLSQFVFSISGILLTAAVSWYASKIIQEFNDAFNYIQLGFLYTFGAALYVGWVAGVMTKQASGDDIPNC